jgi:hypothetical protein
MTHDWDEFSKSLAEPVPRRESLRRLGFLFAGAVLSPLGLKTGWAGHGDPCKSFCRCRNKSQQKACLAACNACGKDTSRMCGACGPYVCCAQPGPNEYGACVDGRCQYWCVEGAVVCDGACTFLDWDPTNCGGCGNVCPASAPFCNWGGCTERDCPPGLVLCGDECTDISFDVYNCGACGNVCAGNKACLYGECVELPSEW